MRVVLIVPGYADDRDWGIPVLRDLVRGLAGRHDVTIFALRHPPRIGRQQIDGATLHTLGGASARGFASARTLVRAVAGVVADARGRRPALLHGLWADEPGAVAVAAARLLRVPAVASVLGGEAVALPDIGYGGLLGALNRRLLGFTLRRAARITVPSAHVRRSIEAKVSQDRIETLPLGFDPARFHAGAAAGTAPVSRGRPRILQVGSLVPVKDQHTLLDAFALVAAHLPDAHLHIVGEGPLRDPLERRIRELGIVGRVTLHGWVPHDSMPDCYRAADLYVQSSRHESQGMAVLEAAACGVPVVGTAVGILPELPHATPVPVGDATALSAAILGRLADAPDAGHAATSPAALPLDRYTMRRTLDRLDALYRDVLRPDAP